MLRFYLKTAIRQLLKNRIFSIVNIVGLSTGLAGILSLSLLVYQYYTFDANQKGIDQLYYLKSQPPDGQLYPQTPYPLLKEVIRNCPELEAGTHIQTWNYPWLNCEGKEFQERTEYVDPGYFDVFPFPFRYGDAKNAIKDKYSLVLSAEMAEKFFGKSDPLGKVVMADDSVRLTVTGVLDPVPSNSTIRPTVLLSTALLEDNPDFRAGADWYNTFASNYLRLRKDADPRALESKIARIVKTNYAEENKNVKVLARPFKDISSDESSPVIKAVVNGAIAAGIFILLVVLVNLINLNTAGSYSRTKEMAIKRMIGGSRSSVVAQLGMENGLIIFFSMIIGWLLFYYLLLPDINNIAGEQFGEITSGMKGKFPVILFMIITGLFFTIVSASIPALKLISVKITEAVKGNGLTRRQDNGLLRNVFITIQFSLAVILICVTIILNQQIRYMKTAALGFTQENVAVISLDLSFKDPTTSDTRLQSIVAELKQDPGVKAVSVNRTIPTVYRDDYNTYIDPVSGKKVSLIQSPADAGYLSTFQIPLVEGREFDDAKAASFSNAVYINRSAMKAFGWTTAVGKQLRPAGNGGEINTVAGVMEDFHYRNLTEKIAPLIQWYSGKPTFQFGFLSVRAEKSHLMTVVRKLEKEFKSIPARRSFSYELLSDKVSKQYALLDGISRATNYLALLTIIIASLGMFGLIALFARLRVKEIGIRKVLGASVAGLITMLSKDFMILVVTAIAIATPVAWYIMRRWLQDFAYRTDISWWMFLAGGSVALLIAFLTVGIQAARAAAANPVNSLRTE